MDDWEYSMQHYTAMASMRPRLIIANVDLMPHKLDVETYKLQYQSPLQLIRQVYQDDVDGVYKDLESDPTEVDHLQNFAE